jgi:outer membrane murein-binding lipoprotein Lpp
MPRNFEVDLRSAWRRRSPQTVFRAILGTLLVANCAAAWFAFNPPGGSIESLERQAASLRAQIAQRRIALQRTQAIADKVQAARQAGDRFMGEYFLARRTAYSTLVTEMGAAAKESGVREKEKSYSVDAIEGSATLSLLTITANYEGSYADLIEFVNRLDRSERLLIIDALQAQPFQGGQGLSIQIKLFAVLLDSGSAPVTTAEVRP